MEIIMKVIESITRGYNAGTRGCNAGKRDYGSITIMVV